MSKFQALDKKKQAEVLVDARNYMVSIRQLARVTGLSKGIVERLINDL
ncbi:MAG: hypothetical protein LBD23_02175 [Oscillospiraceae bacterium]|nr:hypothetical protein [Oscillospiraceae bacterium]